MTSTMSRADPSETLPGSVHGSGFRIVSIGRTPIDARALQDAREHAGRALACDLIGGRTSRSPHRATGHLTRSSNAARVTSFGADGTFDDRRRTRHRRLVPARAASRGAHTTHQPIFGRPMLSPSSRVSRVDHEPTGRNDVAPIARTFGSFHLR
jgi:hypothetical protein